MLTYRTGAAGTPSAAMAMAAHLLEQTLPLEQAKLAAYYQRVPTPVSDDPVAYANTIAEVRPDLDPRLAALLGLSPDRIPSREEIANLLAGNCADGNPIPGKQVQRETTSLADELGLRTDRVPLPAELRQILEGRRADSGEKLPESRAPQLRSRLFALYGVDSTNGRKPSARALRYVLSGRRADGAAVRSGPLLDALSATRARIGYVDLCWSTDKSVSLAWAMAPTEAERNLIASAHKEAVASVMLHVEAEIGRARKGKGGRDGYDAGALAWVSFGHYTSRPTVEIARSDPVTGEPYTELVTLKVAGDPQLHTHVCCPATVLADDRVASPDFKRLKGRVHEFGHLYQAFLAKNLRRLGIDVALDLATGAARITAIPEIARSAFSKRTRNGSAAARAYARDCGLDWDMLDDARKVGLAKRGVQGDPRQAKQDDLGDWAAWRRQAVELDWQPQSVLSLDAPATPLERAARIEHAYQVALEVFDKSLQRRAVVDGADARAAAACGLVAAGIDTAGDVDAVMQCFFARGARQDGMLTPLIWNQATDEQGNECMRVTTTLHADREAELIALAGAAAADYSAALNSEELDAAVRRSGFDFETTEHGRTQHAIMRKLGQGGRLSVAIGVAGSGKSTLLGPLVDAWHRQGHREGRGEGHGQGRIVWGAALAWRQSDDLVAAGIPEDQCLALSVFIDRVKNGKVQIGRSGVLVLDELSLISTKMLLDVLQLQAQYEFSIVAVGDPKQCASIEAGPVIELLRRALGVEAVPEILTTLRQHSERERMTSLLFRDARAAEALDIKREDGTARLVAGDYSQTVTAIADLWQERRAANAHDPHYTLTVSTPTNSDARAIAGAIRLHRRAAGELGPDQVQLSACDLVGDAFDLPLAVGDRVRLFNRTNASCADKSRGLLGNNGSVLEVLSIGRDGITLRNARGRIGRVAWDTLRHPESGRIRLTYGDVLSIDSSQGLTSTEHLEALPAGTSAVNAFKAYTASSRHRRATYIIVSDGAERREITTRRPLGDARPIREHDVWANVARNLSRQPEQESALAFMERAHQVRREATTALQIGLQRIEQRIAQNKEPSTLARRAHRRRTLVSAVLLAQQFNVWLHDRSHVVASLSRLAIQVRQSVVDTEMIMRPGIRSVIKNIQARLEPLISTYPNRDQAAPSAEKTVRHFGRRRVPTCKM
jgi:hypothetical protein